MERACKGFSKASKDKLKAELGPRGKNIQFLGFDGNNESEHRSVAWFLVEKMERFPEFKGRSLNSHHPVVERYKAMFRIFEPMRVNLGRRDLSPDDIITLMKID